jgi:hypothetical protein
MKLLSILLAGTFLLSQFSAICQEDWNLKKDENSIKVYTRKSKLFKFDEIKVEATLDGNLSQLAAVLLDVNDHTTWVYKTIESKLLKAVSPSEIFYYTQVSCPWPFQNRDLAVHMTISQNPSTKLLTMEMRHAADFVPEKKGLIRVKYSTVTWLVSPINNKQIKINYQIQVDPSGSLPAWLLNLFITKGPYESFMKLKERLLLPKYAKASFPFLIN